MSKTRQHQQDNLMEDLILKICKQQADLIGKQLDEKLTKFTESLKGEIRGNAERINLLEQKLCEQEQYNKRNNLVIYGIQEELNEGPNILEEKLILLFKNKLQVQVLSSDIDTCYRIGHYNEGKTRAVVAHFVSSKIKMNIFNNKKLLKKTGFVMKEDLTKANLELMKTAIGIYGLTNVWTQNGRIFVVKNNVRKIIRNTDDLK